MFLAHHIRRERVLAKGFCFNVEDTKYPCDFSKRTKQPGRGAVIAQWLERRTRDRKVAGSNPCWSGGRIFFSRVNFLC